MHTETYENYSVVIDSKGALSPKEEVEAAAICLGRSTKESAKLRGVSPETCKCQRANAKSKVDATGQCAFILSLLARGWLTLEGDVAAFSRAIGHCLFRIRETIKVPDASFLESQFHRAQALYQSTPRACSEQQAVAPFFSDDAPGTESYRLIPAVWRKSAVRTDFDNRCRLAQYADRVRALLQREAA